MPQITPDDYELAVFAKMRHDFRSAKVRVEGTENGVKHRVLGRYSLVARQLDVAVYRRSEDRPFLVADAKRHLGKLDVKDAEMFIGMVDDIGAEIGVLVAPEGFTSAAERRARAASTRVLIMTLEQALTYRWLPEARQIYPYDWAFHEQLAHALRLLDERASAEAIIETLELIWFEEWDSFVVHALKAHPAEAQRFLVVVAGNHPDDGWRFNAVRHLLKKDLLGEQARIELLREEDDSETIGLLAGEE